MIRVGLIGAGRMGHARTLGLMQCPNAHIAAIAHTRVPNDETMAWIRAAGTDRFTTDYRDILADPSIEAVFICSSTDTHAAIALEAIEAGKQIFCEKPVDLSVDRVRMVMQALEKHPVKFQVGYNRRFDHNFHALHEAVRAGAVGEVQMVRVCSRDHEPPTPAFVPHSGGMLLDMLIHDFDQAEYLSGHRIESVYAMGAVLVERYIGEAGDVDTAVVVCRLDNGALAVIDGSRRASYGLDHRAEVFGSLGSARIENDTASTLVVSNVDGVTAERQAAKFTERFGNAFMLETCPWRWISTHACAPCWRRLPRRARCTKIVPCC